MSAERFTIDTNILVYSIDRLAGPRHRLAAEIMERAVDLDCCLTLQAISEFYVVVTRKGVVPRDAAAGLASDWMELFPMVGASAEAVRMALAESAAGRVSYWDALLLATAAAAGCRAIVTEDLGAAATIGGVRVVHPFAESALSEPLRRLLATG